MARSFIGFGQVPYIGQTYTTPLKFGGIASQCVPLLFQWLAYGASSVVTNINVLVSIDNANCRALDQIRSIYIDNLGSDTPIYVNFPDTNYTVVAKPDSEGWYPVFTNGRTLWVIGEGFVTNDIPTTFILLSNLQQIPSVNTEIDQSRQLLLASPLITRGPSIFNSNLATPAVADQFFASATLAVTAVNNAVALWNTPYPSGFIYLNSFTLDMAVIGNGGAGTVGTCQLSIESTGIAGPIGQPAIVATPAQFPANFTLFSGVNLKLDATQTWRLRVISTANITGTLQALSAFTQQ